MCSPLRIYGYGSHAAGCRAKEGTSLILFFSFARRKIRSDRSTLKNLHQHIIGSSKNQTIWNKEFGSSAIGYSHENSELPGARRNRRISPKWNGRGGARGKTNHSKAPSHRYRRFRSKKGSRAGLPCGSYQTAALECHLEEQGDLSFFRKRRLIYVVEQFLSYFLIFSHTVIIFAGLREIEHVIKTSFFKTKRSGYD